MAGRPGMELRAALLELMAAGVDAPLPDDAFDVLAGRVLDFQLQHNSAYAAYVRRRLGDGAIPHWTRIPGVPTSAFRELPLVAGDATRAAVTFLTSGTTAGAEKRGAHPVLDPALYHASLLPTFIAYVLPDGLRPRMLSLVPPAASAPDSSLSWMIDTIVRELGPERSGFFADPGSGLDEDGLETVLQRVQAKGTPVCLLATTLAMVHWLDSMRARGVAFQLPPGSRIMDTGGFKGRAREVSPGAMRDEYRARLGIPADHVVNEYGMTELLSQRYDTVLRDAVRATGVEAPGDVRRKGGPPWLRTVAADPDTLEPLPAGTTGLLRHVDLANLFSVLAVQTEDLGYVEADGTTVLLGRAAGAPPRGCSIAADLLLEAARTARR